MELEQLERTPTIKSIRWVLMAWCFSTRASVATVLSMHTCASSCLRVKLAKPRIAYIVYNRNEKQTYCEDTPASWLPVLLSRIGSQVKVTNLKNLPKLQFFLILIQPLHGTHLLKLLDKMCKYEMDPTSIVEDTKRTRFCPQTDGQGETSIPPFQLCWSGRYNNQICPCLP